MYETEWEVRFEDIDQAQTLYYPKLFNNMHLAFEIMLEDKGVPLPMVIDELQTALPIVEVKGSYEAPIRFGDTILININPDIGSSSISVDYIGQRKSDKTRVFESQEIRVAVDAENFQEFEPKPVPGPLRKALVPR